MFVFGRSQNAPTDMEGASIELRNTHNLVGAIHESPEIALQNSHNLVGARIARPPFASALCLQIGVEVLLRRSKTEERSDEGVY